MSFPSTLTGAIDGVTEIEAAHLNNLEAKVGVDIIRPEQSGL
jgi:hypothetical protein